MKKEALTHGHVQTCVDVKADTQESCLSATVAIESLTPPVVIKVPVTLAQITVPVNVDACITLPEPALEIKDIKKNVKVTQCLLVRCGGLQFPAVLFLKGFVRKNIQYATRQCSNVEGVCGDIRHCTVDVPFSCTTNVNFNLELPEPLDFNTTNEFSYFRTQKLKGPGFAEKDRFLSGDFSEFNQVSQEYFNELPYCELVSARIVEYDEFLNRTRPSNCMFPFEEKEFAKIEEKMILNITIKILQNRQVTIQFIPPPPA